MVVASYLIKFGTESYRHFMAKASLFYRLRELGHDVISELELPGGYVDICDKTTFTIYELEFTQSRNWHAHKVDQYKTAGYDVIVIDCSKLPDDVFQMKMYLEEFIVPD